MGVEYNVTVPLAGFGALLIVSVVALDESVETFIACADVTDMGVANEAEFDADESSAAVSLPTITDPSTAIDAATIISVDRFLPAQVPESSCNATVVLVDAAVRDVTVHELLSEKCKASPTV